MTNPDLSSAPTDQGLSRISELGQKLYEAEKAVLQLEADLRRAVRARDELSTKLIPDVMEELGLESFKTRDFVVEVDSVLRVQPKAESRPLVIQALEDMQLGSIVKTTVIVAFDRGQDAEVDKAVKLLAEMGRQPKLERKVEPATLKKVIKDRLEEGKPVDMDLFGVSQFRKAEFSSGAPTPPVFEGE